MKITVIGCGNAFSYKSANQSFLIQEDENGETKSLLVDCGNKIPQQLYNLGLHELKVDFYLSHLHGDHHGGLEEKLLQRYDFMNFPRRWDDYLTDSIEQVTTVAGHRVVNRTPKKYWVANKFKPYAPKLYGNKQVLEDLWNKALSGGMETTQGFTATLETFCEPVPLEKSGEFEWCGWTFKIIQQIHIVSDSSMKDAYGLMISKAGHKTMYLTTDTQYLSPAQMQLFYQQADIIIQDAEFIGINTLYPEGAEVYYDENKKPCLYPNNENDPDGMARVDLMVKGFESKAWKRFLFTSGVHASYGKLAGYASANDAKLPPEIRAKMWLSHYQDFVLAGKDMFGNLCDWNETLKRDGFAGLARVSQVFEI